MKLTMGNMFHQPYQRQPKDSYKKENKCQVTRFASCEAGRGINRRKRYGGNWTRTIHFQALQIPLLRSHMARSLLCKRDSFPKKAIAYLIVTS
jgi:hypothetical protein